MRRNLGVHPEIEQQVNRTLSSSGPPRIPNGFGIDVEAIIQEYYDMELAWIPNLQLGGREALAAYVRDLRLILVEYGCSEERQRFSMAHELGHAQLEDDYGDAESLFQIETQGTFSCTLADTQLEADRGRSRDLRRRAEVRANQFAALLLMPEGLVKEAWRLSPDMKRCASLLLVSREALGYRLSALGLQDQEVQNA